MSHCVMFGESSKRFSASQIDGSCVTEPWQSCHKLFTQFSLAFKRMFCRDSLKVYGSITPHFGRGSNYTVLFASSFCCTVINQVGITHNLPNTHMCAWWDIRLMVVTGSIPLLYVIMLWTHKKYWRLNKIVEYDPRTQTLLSLLAKGMKCNRAC